MNEFLKICVENGIDIHGAQHLMRLARGDAEAAINFLDFMRHCRGEDQIVRETKPDPRQNTVKCWPQNHAAPYGIGKHGIVKDQYSDSSLYCGHANECPVHCPCGTACHCRTHGNCGPVK
jgi:hypothetical protein